MLRALVIVITVVALSLVVTLAVLIRYPSKYTGPDPNHIATVGLHVDVGAQGQLIEYFRRFSAENDFDFDFRDSPRGRYFFSLGLVRKGKNRDIVIDVAAPFFDPREIEVAVVQDDDDPATPPRVDALKASIEKTIVDLPGVRLEPVTGMTAYRGSRAGLH